MLEVDVKIENIIYEVRGKQVMLDSKLSAVKCQDIIMIDNNTLRYW